MTDHAERIDKLLAAVTGRHDTHGRATTRYTLALEATAQGHSGRPAGTGEPGGGTGASATTVVERVALNQTTMDRAHHDLLAIPDKILTTLHAATTAPLPPERSTPLRKLVWARWVVRTHNVAQKPLRTVWGHADQLDRIVTAWINTRTPSSGQLHGLAHDLTGMWCRSCLRIGHRNPRDDRYTADGVCRWCGDFHGAQGWWPTPQLLAARRDGRRITGQMVADAKKTRKKK